MKTGTGYRSHSPVNLHQRVEGLASVDAERVGASGRRGWIRSPSVTAAEEEESHGEDHEEGEEERGLEEGGELCVHAPPLGKGGRR